MQFMSQPAMPDNVYEGTLDIDGVINTTLVLVYFPSGGCSAWIHDGTLSLPGFTRKDFHLTPLNVGMLRAQESQTMAAGIHYAIEGTKLGVVTRGPLGNPADGEYDVHVIRHFEVLSTFTAREVTVSIEGATQKGTSGWRDDKTELPPLSFRIVFTVPLARMEQFFGIPHEHFKDFEKRVKACG